MKSYTESENGWIFEVMVALLTIVFCFLVMKITARYCARSERAAYLEGRFDLDHATAWHFAGEEVR